MLLKNGDPRLALLTDQLGEITVHDCGGKIFGRVQFYDTGTREAEITLEARHVDGDMMMTALVDAGDRVAKVQTRLPGSYVCFGGKRWPEADPEAEAWWRETTEGRFGKDYPRHPEVLDADKIAWITDLMKDTK